MSSFSRIAGGGGSPAGRPNIRSRSRDLLSKRMMAWRTYKVLRSVDGVQIGAARRWRKKWTRTWRETKDKAHTKEKKLDWNNLGGHQLTSFGIIGQVLDAPERLREVVEALS